MYCCVTVELIDKCVGSKIWIVMKGDKGTFDLVFFKVYVVRLLILWNRILRNAAWI